MYPWISRIFDFWLPFCEKKCGLYMDVYGTWFLLILLAIVRPQKLRIMLCLATCCDVSYGGKFKFYLCLFNLRDMVSC